MAIQAHDRRWWRRGNPFNFLIEPDVEIALHFSGFAELIPEPSHVVLATGQHTRIPSYPVLRSPAMVSLDQALQAHIAAMELSSAAGQLGHERSRNDAEETWRVYRDRLIKILDNVLSYDYGRGFSEVFWLYHSMHVVRALRGTPSRLREIDLDLGRSRGDAFVYSILLSYLDRVCELSYQRAQAHAERTEQPESAVIPKLLQRMRDNLLIFTEDHIGRDLAELRGYFRGYLRIDAPGLFYRFALLRRWHAQLVEEDEQIRAAIEHLLHVDPAPDVLLLQPGYVKYLATHPLYSESRFLDRREIGLWDGLVLRLKEFELLNTLRRQVVEIEIDEDGEPLCDRRSASRLGLSPGTRRLARDTRPLDFSAPWVVDPEVSRAGLVYDITSFSSVVSNLRRGDRRDQQEAFRQVFLFQHRLNRLAARLGLRWEKYLGDGAFYSSDRPDHMLLAAILMQRRYRRALRGGFAFDRGLRIALNHGTYRLLPLSPTMGAAGDAPRYEVFGYGVVELSRLVSGKKGLDLEEIMTTLVARGYSKDDVDAFFTPLARGEIDLSESSVTDRAARVTADGVLVNEGIVATRAFLAELESEGKLGEIFLASSSGRELVVLHVDGPDRTRHSIGVARLGTSNLKGLGRVTVYEIVDLPQHQEGGAWEEVGTGLLETLDSSYSSSLATSTKAVSSSELPG